MKENADNTFRLCVSSLGSQLCQRIARTGSFLFIFCSYPKISPGKRKLNLKSGISRGLQQCFLRLWSYLVWLVHHQHHPLNPPLCSTASQYPVGWTRPCSYLRPRPRLRLFQEETSRQCVSACVKVLFPFVYVEPVQGIITILHISRWWMNLNLTDVIVLRH